MVEEATTAVATAVVVISIFGDDVVVGTRGAQLKWQPDSRPIIAVARLDAAVAGQR